MRLTPRNTNTRYCACVTLLTSHWPIASRSVQFKVQIKSMQVDFLRARRQEDGADCHTHQVEEEQVEDEQVEEEDAAGGGANDMRARLDENRILYGRS